MDPGFLDVFHDASDVDGVAITYAIDVDFDRVIQIAIDQHGIVARNPHRFTHVTVQAGGVVDDLHRSAAQNVTGTDHHREADALVDFLRLPPPTRDAGFRLPQPKPMQEHLN